MIMFVHNVNEGIGIITTAHFLEEEHLSRYSEEHKDFKDR